MAARLFDKEFEARFRTVLRCFFALAKNYEKDGVRDGTLVPPPGYYRIDAGGADQRAGGRGRLWF